MCNRNAAVKGKGMQHCGHRHRSNGRRAAPRRLRVINLSPGRLAMTWPLLRDRGPCPFAFRAPHSLRALMCELANKEFAFGRSYV